MPLIFAPDVDTDKPGVISAASGIRPTLRGYAQWATAMEYNQSSGWGTLGTTPNNLWSHHWSTNGRILAGAPTKLYELSLTASGTFTVTDVSKSGGTYTAPSYSSGTDDEQDPSYWCFASVGDTVYASNKFTTRIQKQSAKAGSFDDVSASPPCSTLVSYKNFLVAGNVGDYGSTTGMKDMIAWTALGNVDSWTPSQKTQAGNYRLLDVPGRIVTIMRLGDSLAIYKSGAIWLAQYQGPPFFFSFQLVEQNIGVNAAYNFPPPIVDIGNAHIFVGQEDIYMWNGSGPPQSITIGTVRRYLRGTYFNEPNSRLPGTRMSHDITTGDIYFWDYGLVFNHWFKRWGALPTAEIALPVATCNTNEPATGGGGPGVINNPGTLFVKSDKKVYNRYRFSTDATAYTFQDMSIRMERGNNGFASTLQRCAPKFSVVPAGSCTLTYSRLPSYGGAATADGSGTWDGTNYRFDLVRNAYWHRLDMGFVSTSTAMEISEIEQVLTVKGKRVEGPLQ